MKYKLLSVLAGIFIVASSGAISFAQTSDATARLQTTVNQIANLYDLCIDRSITHEQYKTESNQLLDGIYRDGLIVKEAYDGMLTNINHSADKCKLYQSQMEQLDAASIAYDNHEISADTLRMQVKASLHVMLDNQLITQERLDTALSRLEDTLRPEDQRRAQPVQPVQTPQQTPSAQEMYYQALGAAMTEFTNGKISEHELRSQYTVTLDKMVNEGIISAEQRTQIMDNLGSFVNQANKYKSFNEEIKVLNARFESGKMTSKRWEKEALALIDKKEKEHLFSAQEAEEYRKQIKQRVYDFRHNITDTHEEYHTTTYTTKYGNTVTTTFSETVYDTDADNHRRPSAFQMQFGPMGGVIFDHQGNWLSGKGSVYENSNSFVSLRQEDEILGYAGLNFELGYTWRRIFSANWLNWLGIGLFVRQDAACGIWTGDTANTHDPEIIGITTGGLRLEFGFLEGALYWGYDFGVGIAYATGDSRDDRYNSDYRPAYFYDTDFNSSVNLDILLGTYFNYFFADDVGFGFGLYFNFTLKDFENEAGSISHNAIILQPDIHLVIDI